MNKTMSKSEARRIAIQKGLSPEEILEEFAKREKESNPSPKCFYCMDKCICHVPGQSIFQCGCPVSGSLKKKEMKLSQDEIKKLFINYKEVEEAVERVSMGVYRLRHPYRPGTGTHHGGPQASYEHFYVEGDNIEVSLDTGCCGSYDSDWLIFPLNYLYMDNWQEEEKKKIEEEKKLQEERQKEFQKKQQDDREALEREQYEHLKTKYEPKK